MHLWSATRLPTAAIAWRAPDGALALTAVGKATFRLEPGTSRLALVQEPIAEKDLPGPGGGLRLLGDLAPHKARADVLVVGAASGTRPRLLLGPLDVTLEVAQGRLIGGGSTLAALPDPIAFALEGAGPQPLATTLETVRFSLWGGGGGVTGSHPLRPDTLWLDLDRGLACVTYRAVVPVESEEHLRATILSDPPPACDPVPIATRDGGGPATSNAREEEELPARTTSLHVDVLPEPATAASALPFRSLPKPLPPPPPSQRGVAAPPPPTVALPPPATPRPAAMRPAPSTPAHPAAISPVAATSTPVPATPSFVEASPARPALVHDSGAALAGGVAGASDAAARASGARRGRVRRSGRTVERPPPTSNDLCDLLWFDPALPARARRIEAWSAAVSDGGGDRPFLTFAESLDDAQAAKDRRTITRALARVTPTELSTLPRLLAESFDDDGFVQHDLLVVAGELTLPLDPAEELRATVELASALAPPDRIPDKAASERLREALESAGDAGQATRAAIDALLQRIRQAFAQATRAVPPDYLETTVQQTLRDERKHQLRDVFGGPHLVARIQAGTGVATPLYLPAEAADRLPIAARFRARLVTEPHPQQHGADGEGAVLRALALGRVLAQRPRGGA